MSKYIEVDSMSLMDSTYCVWCAKTGRKSYAEYIYMGNGLCEEHFRLDKMFEPDGREG